MKMHSSLRILQIALIITTVKRSSSMTSATTAVIASTTASQNTAASPNSSVTASPLKTLNTSIVSSNSAQTVSEQLSQPSDVSNSSNVKTGAPSSTIGATSSKSNGTSNSVKLLTSTSLGSTVTVSSSQLHLNPSSVSGNTAETDNVSGASTTATNLNRSDLSTSPTQSMTANYSSSLASQRSSIVLPTAEPKQTLTTLLSGLARETDNVSGASTTATNLNHSGLLTSPTQSMTANYSSSLASQRSSIVSTTAEPKQTLTTLLPESSLESVDWTDWSVDSSHCQKYCSEKGGTVTASRQCYAHLITLADSVCIKHNISTKVVKCDEECPISGKEAFGSSISTLVVSTLLVILSATFVRD